MNNKPRYFDLTLNMITIWYAVLISKSSFKQDVSSMTALSNIKYKV